MTFLGKMCLMIMLKGTKKQGFTLSVEDTFFEKPQEKVKLTPTPSLSLSSRFRVKFQKFFYRTVCFCSDFRQVFKVFC